MSRVLLTFLFVVLIAAPFHGAWADVFYMNSLKGEFSASFPDHWDVVNNQKPNDVLTLAASDARDAAMCRVRMDEDKRFAIYPSRFADDIRDVEFSQGFWVKYLMEFKDAALLGVNDRAGLGRGFASHAEALFTTVDGEEIDKHGVMFVSHYGNKLYVVECAAREEYFAQWKPAFMSFVKSVDFKKHGYEHPRGNYRDFLDNGLKIYGAQNVDAGRY